MTGVADKMTGFRAGITAIDCDYVRPRLAASHLVVDSGRAAFVDTGTTHSVPTLLAALEARGLAPADVDWVLTTHVHLDHAGGAGALMQALPNARCAVHPRGAPHLIKPGKLIAGSIAVYGEARYHALYGEIVPIPEARVFVAEDGARIALGARTLELIHTPGHALHHYCVVDAAHALLFSGDTFGLSYRDFDVDGRAFIIPTTTPVHFDPEALCRSVDRLMSYGPKSVFLTHYAEVTELERLSRELKERVVAFADLGRRYRGAPDRAMKLRNGMFAMIGAWLDAHGFPRDDARRHRLLDDDVELNCQGIEHWLDRVT
jgi:glyoxylase-like metal-dependent hydrolase (beta-lactamase superfamily II)